MITTLKSEPLIDHIGRLLQEREFPQYIYRDQIVIYFMPEVSGQKKCNQRKEVRTLRRRITLCMNDPLRLGYVNTSEKCTYNPLFRRATEEEIKQALADQGPTPGRSYGVNRDGRHPHKFERGRSRSVCGKASLAMVRRWIDDAEAEADRGCCPTCKRLGRWVKPLVGAQEK